jgi:hypothetical protein
MPERMSLVEAAIRDNTELFAHRWGPIRWRTRLAGIHLSETDPILGRMFWALSNIEDESAYMRNKIRIARADRLTPVSDFNIMWLAEEAEHSRALEAMSRILGYPYKKASHDVLSRDSRALFSTFALRIGSMYQPGMLGAYLTLGAMQEHTALTTYNAIASLDIPTQISSILRDISRQEGRHMRFYRSSAEAVFRYYPKARIFVKNLVARTWRPVGIDLLGTAMWKETFLPYLNTESTRDRLVMVDEVASKLLGESISVMRVFLQNTKE